MWIDLLLVNGFSRPLAAPRQWVLVSHGYLDWMLDSYGFSCLLAVRFQWVLPGQWLFNDHGSSCPMLGRPLGIQDTAILAVLESVPDNASQAIL